MKAYLFTTGALFTLIAVAHFLRTIAEWLRFGSEPWFLLQGPGLGVVSAALAFWALWLLWKLHRP